MFSKKGIATAVTVLLFVMLLYSFASAAVGRYQMATFKEGNAEYSYLLDTDSGDVWEVKQYKSSKGELEHYMKKVPAFSKEKEVMRWSADYEEKYEIKK